MISGGHKDQGLIRDFLWFCTWCAAGNGIGSCRPCHAAENSLADDIQTAFIIGIQHRVDLIGSIPHVGTALTVWAVHKGVTHADGNCIQAFPPELI